MLLSLEYEILFYSPVTSKPTLFHKKYQPGFSIELIMHLTESYDYELDSGMKFFRNGIYLDNFSETSLFSDDIVKEDGEGNSGAYSTAELASKVFGC